MILSHKQLFEWASTGGLEPFDPELTKVGPASIDLRLANTYRIPHDHWSARHWDLSLDMHEYDPEAFPYWTEEIEFEEFYFLPGQVALMSSVEYMTTPDDCEGWLFMRSSYGRMMLEHAHCLSGDTPIRIPRDISIYPQGVPIKDLVGKNFLVYSYDSEKSMFTLSPAEAFPARKNTDLVRVTYKWMTGSMWKQNYIECTPDHKFLTLDKEWVEAQSLGSARLMPGAVELKNHKVISVEKVEGKHDTYDIHTPSHSNFVANGVVVHNSGLIDPGFMGQLTFEFINHAPWPILLKPNDRVMQLVLARLESIPERTYQDTGRYVGQTGPTPRRL